MVPRLLAAARAMRSRTCADVIQPCWPCEEGANHFGKHLFSLSTLKMKEIDISQEKKLYSSR